MQRELRGRFRTIGEQRACGGFSLVEALLVVSVVVVGILTLSHSLVTSMRLNEVNRETARATDGIQEMIELLDGVENFSTIFVRYNADPNDDPGSPGSAPGNGFAVGGLDALDLDPDGLVGEIIFPTVTVAGGIELREDVLDESLGMPRDLDGDGSLDGDDHSRDYRILPVAVRLRWNGFSGERAMEVRTLIADR